MSFADSAAIVGVGLAGPWRVPDVPERLTGMHAAAMAFEGALTDSGLDRDEIDGLVVNHGNPVGPDYDQLAQFLDLKIDNSIQLWAHGRNWGATLQIASWMVQSGAATHVACVDGHRRMSTTIGGPTWHNWREELRRGGGPHGELPAAGLTAPVGQAAMTANTYCTNYGIDPKRLYHVVANQRRYALMNPKSIRHTPLDEDSYAASPMIVDPLRRADIAPVSAFGACHIVSTSTAARKAKAAPVQIRAIQGIPSGRREFFWARPGLGTWLQDFDDGEQVESAIFSKAGVTQADLAGFYCYDAFSPLVWLGLERFGFCPPGTAPDFVEQSVVDGVDAALPVNTGGGLLNGSGNPIYEIVQQMRGDAGGRQLKNPDVLLWGDCFGSAIVFAR